MNKQELSKTGVIRRKKYLNIALFLLVVLLMPMQASAGINTPNLDSASSWAQADIELAVMLGIVPQHLQSQYTYATTRADFAALAVYLYESFTGRVITGHVSFADTNDINVGKMASLGVVEGVGNNMFAPHSALTREQAATLTARLAVALGHPLPAHHATFADNHNISSWAISSVGQVQNASIMSGVGNNMFAPRGLYTREQSIISMLRLFAHANTARMDGGSAQPMPPAHYVPTHYIHVPTPTPTPFPTPTPTPFPTPTPTPSPTPEPTPTPTPSPTPEPTPTPTPSPTPEPTPTATPPPTPTPTPSPTPEPTPTPTPHTTPPPQMTIPNRRLTLEERDRWIQGYYAHGGVNSFELELVRLINIEREHAGIAPLAVSPTLMHVARFKAQSMADLDYFSPHNPHYGIITHITRDLFELQGILSIAQNASRWSPSPQAIVQGWMDSDSQRRNILNPDFVETGVGAINTSTGMGSFDNLWVQVFVETEAGVVNPPNIPQSQIQLPNRQPTQEELNQWIAEYHAMGGVNEFEQEVLRLTNIERANYGLAPLYLHPTLMMSARFKSQSMADLNYFSHENPIFGHFVNISQELFDISIFGENIAIWQRTPEEVVAGWMSSPSHRALILNPDFTHLGVGFFRERWTQKFSIYPAMNH